ncbi:MAG TPA: hypothetical protein VHB20_14680 [Verrucomicrobiae bacterium]|jgi:hypothetical protein|nr:hypothetical protein [Verrucomicrobiae bacterium]
MNIGDFRTRRKVTGKFYFADIATPAALNDFGNVTLIKQNPKVDRAQMMTAQKGFLQVTHEEPSKIDWRYQVKLDEHSDALLSLLRLASTVSSVTQNSASGASWSISSASPGFCYYVGALGLTAFTMTTYTLGSDYTIDLGSGMLTILATGTIAASTSLSGTLTNPQVKLHTATAFTKTFWRGQAQINTFDQNSLLPRDIVSGAAELIVSDWGEHDGQKWNEVQIELLFTAAPTLQAPELP